MSVSATPDDSIALRRLVAGDAATYRSLMLDAYARHADAFTSTVAERGALPLDWWRARIDDEIVWGAWRAASLVGVAGLARETRPKSRHKANLYGMYVAPSADGRGVGARLVAAILDAAAAEPDLRIVQLTCSAGNRRALALYERAGFATFGVEPFAIAVDGGYLAKHHLWLDLAARGGMPARRPDEAVSRPPSTVRTSA